MKSLALLLMLVVVTPGPVYAGCYYYDTYDAVTTTYEDGSSSTVYYYAGVRAYCTSGGGGVANVNEKKGGGGGPSTPTTPSSLTTQRQMYADKGCSTPALSEFLDINGFAASGLGTWTTFSDFKMSDADYVLIDPALVTGMLSIGLCMDNQMPRNSDPGHGGGYRLPGTNAITTCGAHTYGKAIDLSIRAVDYNGNNTGAHDCRLWNALAACAHAAGGWVEPWSQIAATGLLHMHIGFGQPVNTPAEYGDACAQ